MQTINDLELETECRSCLGDGWYWRESVGGKGHCQICNGSGYEPTAIGEKILLLLKHNLRPMLDNDEGG